jgi:hypothetical protein
MRVATHVTTAVVERLPVPTRRDGRGTVYQLSVSEFEHVLETFPLVPRKTREAALRALATITGAYP